MNGYEATEEIRRLEGSKRHVTIVAMTAEATVSCQEQCTKAGMDGFISKPVKVEDVIQAIRDWVLATEAHPV
jgi:two-component system, sensor histidine kinase and response regulator